MGASKTVRFSKVVEQCGRPEPYTLWAAPEADKDFQRALNANRVMTIHQETAGAKTDFGEVGFGELGRGNLLVFPKSLKSFEGMRVVGVKYDLLEASEKPAPGKAVAAAKPKPPVKKPVQIAPPTSPPVFRVMEAPLVAPSPKPSLTVDKPASPKSAPASGSDPLKAAVHRAMKQLQAGKPVAAYQTLEKALATSGRG